MKTKNREFRSCFISAPFGADLGTLTRVLDRAGIRWEWAKSDLGLSGRLPEDLRKIIRAVDFVIGVFLGGPAIGNTLFEVGLAVGTGKPVLLIVADESEVPLDLAGFPFVQASLTDDKAIELHLDLLIRSSRHAPRYPVSGQSRSAPGVLTEGFTLRSSVPHDVQPANQLEAELVSLIEQAGGRTLLHPRPQGGTDKFAPDLLFWLPTSDAELLNPAVVELKGYPTTPPQLVATEQQLLQFLRQTGVRTGLIIVPSLGKESRLDFRGSPLLNIFRLDFETFRDLLKSGQLPAHLRQERNRAAHGLR
jgi:hypothetical protein